MSRHRNVRKLNYDEERDDAIDEDFHRYSISTDDDSVSCGSIEQQYIFQRNGKGADSDGRVGFALSDYIEEEGAGMDAADYRLVDDDIIAPTARQRKAAEKHRQQKQSKSDEKNDGGVDIKNNNDRLDTGPVQMGTSKAQVGGSQKQDPLRLPEVENLRVAETTVGKQASNKGTSRGTIPSVASCKRLTALEAAQSAPVSKPKIKKRTEGSKPTINLVIVGHVDVGKSTLMGHLLYKLGDVDDRTMRKYKQESAKTGKGSFAFAWVLDDTQEERERGVTMDIARNTFDTEHRRIAILDAPGHRDFIPNMITGAAEADAAVLVVNASRGEFESGFDQGGQTREHAVLLRSLGVGELLVAVNKLDTIEWSQQRFDELSARLKTFLRKQAGFPNVRFVPVSGLFGINLTQPPADDHPLRKWYTGPTLLQLIDELKVPERAEDRPFRAIINDIFKGSATSLTVSARIEAGSLENGEKVYIMPNADAVTVKSITVSDNSSANGVCFAGDQVSIVLNATSTIEPDSISGGHVLCRGGTECLVPGKRYLVRIVLFNVVVPIIKGSRAELFAHSLCEPCTVTRLRAVLDKATGEVVKRKPRCLTKNMSGVVELETQHAICLEAYSDFKTLGRITLRDGGQTIAAGIIEQRLG